MRLLRWAACVAFGVWLAVCAGLFLFQESLLFKPDPTRVSPRDSGFVTAQSAQIVTPDGAELVAWWVPPKDGHTVVLYLHGNAGNLASRVKRFAALHDLGVGLLAIDWRGYGGSSGLPSEAAFHADTRTAYQWLVKQVPSASVVVFGESLGTAPAIKLASEAAVAGLILEAPFTSILALAQMQYPYVPVSLLLRHPFRSLDWIGAVNAPVLILHGSQDDIVPLAHSQVLHNLIPASKTRVVFEGHPHIVRSDAQFRDVVGAFLQGL